MMITSPTPKPFGRCLLSLFLLLGACNTPPPEQWTSLDLEVSNAKVLHEVIMLSMANLNYPMGPGTAPGNGEVVSGWLESRSPFYGRGYRLRAFVKYSSVKFSSIEHGGFQLDGSLKESSIKHGGFRLECRVEKEINESHQGLDRKRDEWKRVGDDNTRRGHLLAKIKAYLAP
jgi:hypothetical protein